MTNNLTFPLERAIGIAAMAHKGQVDKGGQPYILHPLRVMLALDDPEDRIAAVLHDVIEDTHITAEYLGRRGLSTRLLNSLQLLTHHRRDSYMDYIKMISLDSRATRVKLADLADNLDPNRTIPGEDYGDWLERQDKYLGAKEYLERHK